ncbi:MAG: hypothetical protein D6776_11255 [Planctomycetota bacterium]|nr:MAG: hypothetical protein D6776_11255 [Planctomycetota bacterium]
MVLEALTLLGIGFIGTLVWVVSTEAAAIYYGVTLGWPALLVGGIAALGQCAMYALLFLFGERLLRRWRWLALQVRRAQRRWGPRLEVGYLGTSAVASVFGLPPALAPPVLAPSFEVPLVRLLPVMFAGRCVRFTVLALAGSTVAAWFGLG